MNFEKIKTIFILTLNIVSAVLILAIFIIVFSPGGKEDETGDVQETLAAEADKANSGNTVAEQKNTPSPNPNAKLIALTFDDGPENGVTDRILDTLQKYNAKATFFVIGRQVKDEAEHLKRAVSLGCEIGNHTWEHRKLTNSSKKQIETTLKRTNSAVKRYADYDIKLMRSTYGEVSKKIRRTVDYPIIFWNVDTEDWRSEDAKKIQKKIYGKVKDGDIVLMHDIYRPTAKAVKKIVPYLLKKGYELVTVSELMERKGMKLKKGMAYYSGR